MWGRAEQGKTNRALPGTLKEYENNKDISRRDHTVTQQTSDSPRDNKASGVSPCLEEASEQSNQREIMTLTNTKETRQSTLNKVGQVPRYAKN